MLFQIYAPFFVKRLGELSAYNVCLSSVADADPGSGAFLTLGFRSGMGFFPDLGFRILDPGSRISDPRSRIPTRVSTEFRRHGIPSVFFTFLYSVFRAELAAIPAEFRRIPWRIIPWNSAEFHGIPWLFSCTKFRISPKRHIKGAAWLNRVQHGSDKMQHSSVGSALACFMAGPSLNPGSAPQGGFSLWAKQAIII
jgi:hypothetical protein